MSEKTLLERGQWCIACISAEAIHEDDKVSDTAEMLMDGITAHNKMSEEEVLTKLRELFTDGQQELIPSTLEELVKIAEKELGM